MPPEQKHVSPSDLQKKVAASRKKQGQLIERLNNLPEGSIFGDGPTLKSLEKQAAEQKTSENIAKGRFGQPLAKVVSWGAGRRQTEGSGAPGR